MKLVEKSTTKSQNNKRKFLLPMMQLLVEPQLASNCLYLPAGYQTIPSQQQIVAMNFEVSNFKVTNGRTSIQWRGWMDLSSAIPTTLAELLDFGDNYVEVYRDVSRTPPVGMGFNRQCVATFSNGKGYAAKSTNYQQMLRRLKATCAKNDTELLSFNLDSGKWKVQIKHFTKLMFNLAAFENDDESDEPALEEPQPSPTYPLRMSTPIHARSHLRETMETEDQTMRIPAPKYTRRLIVDPEKLNEINRANDEFYKSNYRPKLWSQIRFGGSGFKFQLNRSSAGFQLLGIRKASRQTRIEDSLLDPTVTLNLESLHSIIQKCNTPSGEYAFTLLNILFGSSIKYTMKNQLILHEREGLNFLDAIRTWFESKVTSVPIQTQNLILRELAARRIDSLSFQLLKQGKIQVAEIVSRLEDEIFRLLFPNCAYYPTELQQVLEEDMACVANESWVVQLGMTFWYCFRVNVASKIIELCKGFENRQVESQQLLRLLKLYAQRRHNPAPGQTITMLDMYPQKTLGDDLVGWAISNLIISEEETVFNRNLIPHRLRREVHNILSRLDVSSSLKLVSKDKVVTQKTRLLKRVLKKIAEREISTSSSDQMREEIHFGRNFQTMLQETRVMVGIQYSYYNNETYATLVSIMELPNFREPLEIILRKSFPVDLSTDQKKVLLSKLKEHPAHPSSASNLFKIYLELQQCSTVLSEALLEELISSMTRVKPGRKVGSTVMGLVMSRIETQRNYFSFLFRTKQVTYRSVLELAKKYCQQKTVARLGLFIL